MRKKQALNRHPSITRSALIHPVQPSEAAKQFLLQEYQALFQLTQSTKEIGDTRLTSFITITGVIFTALIGVQQFVRQGVGPWLLGFGSLLLFSLGLLTFGTMLQRRTTTVIARRRMARIRIWFLNYFPELADGMVYNIYENLSFDWGENKIGTTAGYIALVNCSLIMLPLFWLSVQILSPAALIWAIPLGIVTGVGVWFLHIFWKRRYFNQSEKLEMLEQNALAELKVKYSATTHFFRPVQPDSIQTDD